jgi:phospholipase C
MGKIRQPDTSRRAFLAGTGALSVAGLAGMAAPAARGAVRAPGRTPLRHIIVACQENRSFDHYFGFYPRARSFGVPAGYRQPDGHGGGFAPYHLPSTITSDPAHEWRPIHQEWHQGRMDGFYTTNGALALGYYDARELAYYYSLADRFALCGRFFCSVLGPTAPNRLYLASGTAGGNTSNSIAPSTLRWPTILDLLDAAGISFKVYNGVGAAATGLNPFIFFKRWAADPRASRDDAEYLSDLRRGTLPQFSFLVPGALSSEHPPADIRWGIGYIQEQIDALMASSAWHSAAFILTYDEGGGFFDHLPPPRLDAYGAGIRIPTLVVSPYARRGYISPVMHDHSAILKLVEAVFGLPTLASTNHQFDAYTPSSNNEAARGLAHGPAAPPRDGRADTGDLFDVFTFG